MKGTKIMLVTIITLLATWIIFGMIGAFCTGQTIRTCMTHYGMIYPMLLFSWIPVTIVSLDYREKLEE